MSTRAFQVHYVDEVPTDGLTYKERLSDGRRLKVDWSPPDPGPDLESILQSEADLYLLDLELDRLQSERNVLVRYGGGTLAAAIRDRRPDHPIVLLTYPNIWERREDGVGDLQAFDVVIYKSEVNKDPDRHIELLFRLAGGYASLRETDSRDWATLVNLLGAEDDEEALLRQAGPPIEAGESQQSWKVSRAARWVRQVALRFPGILYSSLHAATMLGITENSFLQSRVSELAGVAKYAGLFAPIEGRWWRSRLESLAIGLLTQAGIDGSLNRNFARAFAEVHGEELELCSCIVSGKTPADWVCYALQEPVRIDYTLPYFPDSRPRVMDPARVSYKAIRVHKVRDELFDPSSALLLPRIRGEESRTT